MKFGFAILLVLYTSDVFSQNSIKGCYSSNFPIIGWFATEIKFNEDKSFDYLFAGDLYYDKIKGTYDVVKNEIFLNFPKITDSLDITMSDSLGNLITHRFPVPKNNAANFRPSRLRIKNEKLLVFDQKGHRIKRKMNARERWQSYYLIKSTCPIG
jgi:hypothetical protein